MIDLVNVTKTYETGTHALNGIDMHIDDGEFVFLVGPSGSGKSTIIKLLTAELKPTSGSVLVNGYQLESIKRASIPYMRRTLGVIFQDFRLIENKTVYENVAFAMRVIGAAPKEIKKRVPYVLELVGLENKGRRLPNELSGGEQQRVAIARALINNPTMIIADEPTGNLDPQRSFEIMLLLEQINALGTTVMVVTHEKGLVDRFTKRVVAIDEGRVVSAPRRRERRHGHCRHAALQPARLPPQLPRPGLPQAAERPARAADAGKHSAAAVLRRGGVCGPLEHPHAH